MLEVALYMRVSKGKGRGQDTASQEADLKRWVKANDVWAPRWYVDRLTGKTMDRPALADMLADVELGKVKTIVIWRLDRLGRTVSGVTALFDDLTRRKVNLVSIKDSFDLFTPSGKLMANMLASFAAFETEIRAERIHAGLDAARARGQHLGRKKGAGLGVRLKVSPEAEAMIVRMKSEGTAIAKISRATGLCRQTIYSVLSATQKTEASA